ncbi:MAG: polysaccharide biosynthesis C-terminal domain-containing protein [Chlorobium sp.]|uniref:lipopolysaccharide biosynthesis protein n=1 Tax=Chlorobium sp. TaxID=1095 RepID=UPI0025B84218|nr:polysaccharide biosynthesis C-terminal domain-containing protein [Chlorobium sp.]MCF8383071.1 polysaccharide biosynthesis C-terminal domain-containing protein [Chlorobium sp.]
MTNLKENAHKKLATNALSGMVANVIYMVSRFLLTPFTLHYLSLAEFGLWALCFIILSYAGMGGFGVNSTYIRYSARYLAEGKENDISKLLSTGVAYMFAFSLLFMLALYLGMPLIIDRFHIAQDQQEMAVTLFLGTAAVTSLELTLGGFRFIINGMHEFSKEKTVSIIGGLLEVGAIILLLMLGTGIKGLLYAFSFKVIIETIACWTIARRLLPSLQVSTKLISGEHFKLFIGFGGKVQLLGIFSIFLTVVDRMFITAIAGLTAGGMFEIARKLPSTAGSISSSVFGPFLSTAAHHEGSWDSGKTHSTRERLSNYIIIILSAAATALLPLSFLPASPLAIPPLVGLWITPAAALVALLLLILLNRNLRETSRLESVELKELYLNGIRFTNIINSLLFTFLVAMAHPLIHAWVGKEYAHAAEIMIFLSTAYAIQLCTGPITMIFRGIDRNGRELEYMLVQLILMVVWIPAGTRNWGLTGSAAAITCSSAISTLFFIWRSNATLKVQPREFINRTIAPLAIPILPAAAVSAVAITFEQISRLQSILLVLACGTSYVLACSVLFWTFVLNDGEKQRAKEILPFTRRGSL